MNCEISINMARKYNMDETRQANDKKYTNFIKLSLKLMNLRKKLAKMNDNLERLEAEVLITETTLEEILGDI